MPYQVADGHDNEAGFAAVTPPPASDGLRMPELIFNGDGSAEFAGLPTLDLVWSAISREQRNTLLTAFGLSDTVASNAVTVQVLGNDNAFGNWNATAVYLRSERREPYGWSTFTIRLIQMVGT